MCRFMFLPAAAHPTYHRAKKQTAQAFVSGYVVTLNITAESQWIFLF